MPLSADPAIIERVKQFNNYHKYEGYKIIEFSGVKSLSAVTVRKIAEEETSSISVKGVFIAVGLKPNSSLVTHLVKLNEKGEIIINPDCSTSYPGIFSAGDITDAFGKRIVIASGEGAKAALAARQYILNLRKKSLEF
jgi:alkyl hydroperoxide reductase subunit F